MANWIDREELRQLIREALREALGTEAPPPLRGRAREGGQAPGQHPCPAPAPPRKGEGKGAFRMDSGVLSEAKVVELGRAHTKILVGGDVVVTPLARDKAREMKLEIARQKP